MDLRQFVPTSCWIGCSKMILYELAHAIQRRDWNCWSVCSVARPQQTSISGNQCHYSKPWKRIQMANSRRGKLTWQELQQQVRRIWNGYLELYARSFSHQGATRICPTDQLLLLMTQFDNCLTGRNMVAFGLPEIYSFDKIKSKIVLRKREAITCVVVRFTHATQCQSLLSTTAQTTATSFLIIVV